MEGVRLAATLLTHADRNDLPCSIVLDVPLPRLAGHFRSAVPVAWSKRGQRDVRRATKLVMPDGDVAARMARLHAVAFAPVIRFEALFGVTVERIASSVVLDRLQIVATRNNNQMQ